MNNILISIELNSMGYTNQDCDKLMNNSIDNLEVKLAEEHIPSVVGWNAIFAIIFVTGITALEAVASGFLSELGADLYKWCKKRFRNVTVNKRDFDDSKIYVKFKNCTFNIYCNSREEVYLLFESFNDILEKAIKENAAQKKEVDIDIYKIMNN